MIFTSEPADFKKRVDVVGCYIQCSGKFLLLHRQPHKPNGDKWGMPAGKVDAGETNSQAMCREIREETGLTVSEDVVSFFGSVFVRNEGTDFVYHMFSIDFAELPAVTLTLEEHQGFAWVTPEEAMGMSTLVHDNHACIALFYSLKNQR
jgi:(d)CTP diphosphatase